jgi:hypothetical protein
MKSHLRLKIALLLGVFVLPLGSSQASPAPTPGAAQEGNAPAGQSPGGGRMPLFGKITAISDTSMQVQDTNGDTVTVKITGQTEYRKDRQPAKRTDFKVGDVVVVRGEENSDHSWTAQMIGARSANGPGGRGGFGGGPGGGAPGGGGRGNFQPAGELGKDYVAGEIKSIDAPKLSVLRTDNVTQTIELNEDTSLRKGRDAVTMADIQVGDHLIARGALENNVFVPKTVMVIGAEQWKRMQEMGGPGGGQRRAQSGGANTGSTNPGSNGQTPPAPEPQN